MINNNELLHFLAIYSVSQSQENIYTAIHTYTHTDMQFISYLLENILYLYSEDMCRLWPLALPGFLKANSDWFLKASSDWYSNNIYLINIKLWWWRAFSSSFCTKDCGLHSAFVSPIKVEVYTVPLIPCSPAQSNLSLCITLSSLHIQASVKRLPSKMLWMLLSILTH